MERESGFESKDEMGIVLMSGRGNCVLERERERKKEMIMDYCKQAYFCVYSWSN